MVYPELNKVLTMECNIPFVYAKYGFGDIENIELVIENFEELKDIIEK